MEAAMRLEVEKVRTEGVEMVQRLSSEHEGQLRDMEAAMRLEVEKVRTEGVEMVQRLSSEHEAKLENVFRKNSAALEQLQQKLESSHQEVEKKVAKEVERQVAAHFDVAMEKLKERLRTAEQNSKSILEEERSSLISRMTEVESQRDSHVGSVGEAEARQHKMQALQQQLMKQEEQVPEQLEEKDMASDVHGESSDEADSTAASLTPATHASDGGAEVGVEAGSSAAESPKQASDVHVESGASDGGAEVGVEAGKEVDEDEPMKTSKVFESSAAGRSAERPKQDEQAKTASAEEILRRLAPEWLDLPGSTNKLSSQKIVFAADLAKLQRDDLRALGLRIGEAARVLTWAKASATGDTPKEKVPQSPEVPTLAGPEVEVRATLEAALKTSGGSDAGRILVAQWDTSQTRNVLGS